LPETTDTDIEIGYAIFKVEIPTVFLYEVVSKFGKNGDEKNGNSPKDVMRVKRVMILSWQLI